MWPKSGGELNDYSSKERKLMYKYKRNLKVNSNKTNVQLQKQTSKNVFYLDILTGP